MWGQGFLRTGWSYTDPAYAPGDVVNPVRANAPYVPQMGVTGASASGIPRIPILGLLALVAVMILSETLRRKLF